MAVAHSSTEPVLWLFRVSTSAPGAFVAWAQTAGIETLSVLPGLTEIRLLAPAESPRDVLLTLEGRMGSDDASIEKVTHMLQEALPTDAQGPTRVEEMGRFSFSAEVPGRSGEAASLMTLLVIRGAGENPIDEFDAWYESEHMVGIADLEGVMSARRYRGGKEGATSLAIYLLSGDAVLHSPGWTAVGRTPWSARIRERYEKLGEFRCIPLLHAEAQSRGVQG